jgi:hypothetical protein
VPVLREGAGIFISGKQYCLTYIQECCILISHSSGSSGPVVLLDRDFFPSVL